MALFNPYRLHALRLVADLKTNSDITCRLFFVNKFGEQFLV